MNKNNGRHKVTISVSNRELEMLEDSPVAWNLCKKHKAEVWAPEHWQESEQEIFKVQDECDAHKRYNNMIHKQARRVLGRLFLAWDKNYRREAFSLTTPSTQLPTISASSIS
jgi:hypothetical protein